MMLRPSQTSIEMEKLDLLGWEAGVSIRSYGLRIGIRANNAVALEQAKGCLPFGWRLAKSPIVDNLYSIVGPQATGSSNANRFNILYKGAVTLVRSIDFDEVLRELEIELHSYVATATRQRMFIHAGVVGWRGKAVVIPGKNFSGKTRLVTAFLRAGANYYSDEFAVLDSRGRVHPFPWVLHIREEGLAQPRRTPVEMLGGQAGRKPLPIGMVVLSEYRKGAKWHPRPLTRGQAALAMLSSVISTNHRPESMLPMLSQMVAGATVLKGERGEADEVVHSVLNVIGN